MLEKYNVKVNIAEINHSAKWQQYLEFGIDKPSRKSNGAGKWADEEGNKILIVWKFEFEKVKFK